MFVKGEFMKTSTFIKKSVLLSSLLILESSAFGLSSITGAISNIGAAKPKTTTTPVRPASAPVANRTSTAMSVLPGTTRSTTTPIANRTSTTMNVLPRPTASAIHPPVAAPQPQLSFLDHVGNIGGSIVNSQAFGQVASMAVGLGSNLAMSAINKQMPLDKLLNKAEGYERIATSDANNFSSQQQSVSVVTAITNALNNHERNLAELHSANLNQLASSPNVKQNLLQVISSLEQSVASLRDLKNSFVNNLINEQVSALQSLSAEMDSFTDNQQYMTQEDMARQMHTLSEHMSSIMMKVSQEPYKSSVDVQNLSNSVKARWSDLHKVSVPAASNAVQAVVSAPVA